MGVVVPVLAEAPTAEPPPAPPAPVVPEEPAAPARPCPGCGAGLAEGQNWCLECGTAAPGRLGRRAGWPLAGSVVALTLLLATGAVAATYAALSSDSKRAVRGPDQVARSVPPVSPSAQPNRPPTAAPITRPSRSLPSPPTAPPAPLPKPTAAPKAPKGTPAPKVPKLPGGTPHKAKPPPFTGLPSSGGKRIVLDTDAAGTYNPYGYPDRRFGDPATAIDGDPATAWTVDVGPGGKVGAGLSLDLKSAQEVGALEIRGTQGVPVEIYGARGELPASITDPSWKHLATRRTSSDKVRLTLNPQRGRFRHVLIWIPRAPDGADVIRIAELAVFR